MMAMIRAVLRHSNLFCINAKCGLAEAARSSLRATWRREFGGLRAAPLRTKRLEFRAT